MIKSRALPLIIVILLMLITVYGCQTPAGRSAGVVVDDAAITAKVKGKIFKDSILKGFAISVNTFQGEVTLIGAVDSEEAISRAGELARSTAGVTNVNNHIKLKTTKKE